MAIFNPEDGKFYCECGCGTQIKPWDHWAYPTPSHRIWTEEERQKQAIRCSEQFSGKVMGKEEKERRSEVSLRFWNGHPERREEYADRMSRQFSGVPKTEEHVEKIQKGRKAWWDGLSPEERDTFLRNTFHHPDVLQGNSDRVKAWWASLSEEEKKRQLKLRIHSDEAIRASALANAERGPNKPEVQLWTFLEERFPGMFVPYWIDPIKIGRRWPDFRSTNGLRLVIESFGNPWHIYSRTEEEIVPEYRELGWDCLVVWAENAGDIIFEWPNIAKWIKERAGFKG